MKTLSSLLLVVAAAACAAPRTIATPASVPAGYSLKADAPVYTVEDLGAIDGLVPTVTGMNAAGDVLEVLGDVDQAVDHLRHLQS